MIRSTHQRTLAATAQDVWQLVTTLAADDDRLWPRGWPPMAFDRPLQVGAQGGHGTVRYRVTELDPASGLVLEFHEPTALVGHHAFRLVARPDGATVLRHELAARPVGAMRLLWPLVVRPLHDCLVEELLDRAEAATGEPPARPHRRSAYVRALRSGAARMTEPRARLAAVPADSLAVAALERVDWADCFRMPLADGGPTDADVWRGLFLGARPSRLLRLRDVLGQLVGLKPGKPGPESAGAFGVLDRRPGEVLVGADDRHLDFRLSVAVTPRLDGDPAELVLTTAVQQHNGWGRAYMVVVGPFHRRIVPRMMRRAARSARALASTPPALAGTDRSPVTEAEGAQL